jgi:hypothetical protein
MSWQQLATIKQRCTQQVQAINWLELLLFPFLRVTYKLFALLFGSLPFTTRIGPTAEAWMEKGSNVILKQAIGRKKVNNKARRTSLFASATKLLMNAARNCSLGEVFADHNEVHEIDSCELFPLLIVQHFEAFFGVEELEVIINTFIWHHLLALSLAITARNAGTRGWRLWMAQPEVVCRFDCPGRDDEEQHQSLFSYLHVTNDRTSVFLVEGRSIPFNTEAHVERWFPSIYPTRKKGPKHPSADEINEQSTVLIASRKLITAYQSRRALLWDFNVLESAASSTRWLNLEECDFSIYLSTSLRSGSPRPPRQHLHSLFCRLLCRQILRQWQSDSWHLFYHLIKVSRLPSLVHFFGPFGMITFRLLFPFRPRYPSDKQKENWNWIYCRDLFLCFNKLKSNWMEENGEKAKTKDFWMGKALQWLRPQLINEGTTSEPESSDHPTALMESHQGSIKRSKEITKIGEVDWKFQTWLTGSIQSKSHLSLSSWPQKFSRLRKARRGHPIE